MADQPAISVNDKITIRINQGHDYLQACVVTVYGPNYDPPCEVVYKDGTKFGASKAAWNGDYWVFVGRDDEYGDFIDVAHNPRFASCIENLKRPLTANDVKLMDFKNQE